MEAEIGERHCAEEEIVKTQGITTNCLDRALATRANHILHIPTQVADLRPCKEIALAIIQAFSNLNSRGEISQSRARTVRRQQVAEKLMAHLATDLQQNDNIDEALRPLIAYQATQFITELAQSLQLQPEFLFVKGTYVPHFDPATLTIPPTTPQ